MDATIPTRQPIVIPRAEHNISRSQISPNALKVLYRLRSAGFRACLVGGGVRDLLLGREPKDFDVATDAHPEEVHRLFRNCRLIGRRFRLAHVQFGQEIIEVATFRAMQMVGDDEEGLGPVLDENGRIISDNVYGTIEDDAWRRDFTINALYYDIESFAVLDYANGMEDLRNGVIRLIGEPEQRYREDPVRMLRAVRFAAKLGFRLHPSTEAPIASLGHLLRDIPPARLFDEVLKLFMGGQAESTFELLRHYRLFGHLFPATEHCLAYQKDHYPRTLLVKALRNTDDRITDGKPVTPYFLYAALLWEPLKLRLGQLLAAGMTEQEATELAAEQVIDEQVRHTAIPKRYSQPMKEIWALQPRFTQTGGRRPLKLLGHPRFRAGYDFLLLRAACGEVEPKLAEWWTRFQDADEDGREAMLRADKEGGAKTRRRSRRPRKRRPVAASGVE
ncbi:MAG TPA: polynucleotide adenylyltransferase PcnB [Candidatus Competibacteraceae bacterium]|nr:polynucleotide adenylyltransferase PcnB [Candidatus Competibacteraceae bacterium]